VLVDDKVEALLYFHSSKIDHTLTVEDLELVTSVSLQLSMAMASAGSIDRVRKSLVGTLQCLVAGMEASGPWGRGHSQRVSDYAGVIAGQMGLAADEVRRIRLAGLLHDVGEIAVRLESGTATPEQVREQHVLA